MVIPVSKPKVSPTEKKYRQDLFPDVKEIKNKNLLCTSCGGSVKDLISKGKPIIHPFLETLLCEKCYSFYGDGQFSVDEDGSDKYCRWCGQGGTLFLCSKCTSGFCKRCVKRNLPKSAQAKIEDDDWVCYCCDTAPLYELRAQCWAAQQFAAEQVKNKGTSKNKKGSRETAKRSRDSDTSESEDDVQNKKKRKEDLKKKGNKKHRNGEEKEGNGGGGGRSLRKRDNKTTSTSTNTSSNTSKNKSDSESNEVVNDDDDSLEELEDLEALIPPIFTEEDVPPGVSHQNLNAAINKLSNFVVEIAGVTKSTHKKLLECKKQKLNLKSLHSVESVLKIHEKLNFMISALEQNIKDMRTSLKNYMDEWYKVTAEEIRKATERYAEQQNKTDPSKLENGLPDEGAIENSNENESSEIAEPEAMEIDDTVEVKKESSLDEESIAKGDENVSPTKENKSVTKDVSDDTKEEKPDCNDFVNDKKSEEESIPEIEDEKSKEKESQSKDKENKANEKENKANEKENKANEKESKAKEKESKAKEKESKAKEKESKSELKPEDNSGTTKTKKEEEPQPSSEQSSTTDISSSTSDSGTKES